LIGIEKISGLGKPGPELEIISKKNFPAVPMELSLGGGTAGEYQPYPLGKYF
jgi:hypothetical protein